MDLGALIDLDENPRNWLLSRLVTLWSRLSKRAIILSSLEEILSKSEGLDGGHEGEETGESESS